MKDKLKIIFVILLAGSISAAAAGIIGPAMIVYTRLEKLTAPRPSQSAETPGSWGLQFREIEIPSPVGPLAGWWIPGRAENSAAIVVVHGYGSSKDRMGGIIRMLAENGFAVLAYDTRGHGKSPAVPIGFGPAEAGDLAAAARLAAKMSDRKGVGVFGFSLGAATALLAGARTDAPLAAIAAVGAFADPYDLLYRFAELDHAPFASLTELAVKPVAERFFGIDNTPLLAAPSITEPVLLIHGAADEIAPPDQARRLDAAIVAPHELWMVEGAGHGGAFSADPKGYTYRLLMFFEKSIGRYARFTGGSPFSPIKPRPIP